MYSRILVPLDGTPLAEAIMPHATEIARRFEGTLVLLRASKSFPEAIRQTVSPEPAAAVPMAVDVAQDVVEAEEEAAERYLKQLIDGLRPSGVHAEALVVQGDAAASLVELVKSQRIDLIAMSTHSRSALGRLIHPSVAEHVVHHVNIPVLLLHAES